MRTTRLFALTAASLAALASQLQVGAQSPQQADAFIARAAEALGGAARIRAIRNITVSGYGETAYMNGGGNISASPDAPQKWVSVPEYEKTIDLEHRRMRAIDHGFRPGLIRRSFKQREVVGELEQDGVGAALTVDQPDAASD